MPRPATSLFALLVLAVPTAAGARLAGRNELLRVLAPAGREAVPAHPFVNVVLRLGQLPNGAAADPATFYARLGRANVTDRFQSVVEDGAVVGMHGELDPALLRLGGRHPNRLRLEVRTVPFRAAGGRTVRVRDIDRVRFRAVEAADQPPVALLLADSDIVLPGIPLRFDATQSHDPESDRLTYRWDFGDGATSEEPRPTHTFAPTTADITVRLTVTDPGQQSGSGQVTLLAEPALDPGRTKGVLRIEAPMALEFGAVPVGATAVRTLTVRNPALAATSQLRVRLGVDGAGFALSTTELDLAADEMAAVDLTFAPTTSGHSTAAITAVASAANQTSAHLVAHGYGGEGSGAGPTLAPDLVFYNDVVAGLFGILPSGARFPVDSNVHYCETGPGAFDLCVTDADCAANAGTCPQTSTCAAGARAGEPCSADSDCPGGNCPSDAPFDSIDMCGDGAGGLYLLSDDATYTDPHPIPPDNEDLGVSLLKLQLDGNGTRTAATMLARVTNSTAQLACDRVAAAARGLLYLAEHHAGSCDPSCGASCVRDSREALVARAKSNGTAAPLRTRIDAVEALEGVTTCDDNDAVADLHVTPDGDAVFASLSQGLYRIYPPSLALRITPDVDDVFQVHPDGSVVVVTAEDQGPIGLLRVYKISPEQAVHGAPHLAELTPCARIEVPNNRLGDNPSQRLTFLSSYAVGPAAPGSLDGIVLVSFFTPPGAALSPSLRIQGTVALASPAGQNTCTAFGLVNLEPLEQLTF